jgi:hypothetical protein
LTEVRLFTLKNFYFVLKKNMQCVCKLDCHSLVTHNFTKWCNVWPNKVMFSLFQLNKQTRGLTAWQLYIYIFVITCPIYEIQLIWNSMILIWPFNIIQGQRSWGQLNMTSYICFIQTLNIRCTVYEMQSHIQTHWFDAIKRF